MQLCPYLSFNGGCEAAFNAYVQCFGGRLGELFRWGGSPMADEVPAEWADKIMHGSVTLGSLTLMGADMAPSQYEEPKGFSLSVHIASPAEAERIFAALADGGRVTMPLEKTFWAERFGTLVDRFGIPWSINCESAG
jgi:PhnB protein